MTVAAAFILLPILLLPLVILRKKLARRGIWITACVVLILLASVALNVGCGGGGSGGGGGGGGGGTQTEQVTSWALSVSRFSSRFGIKWARYRGSLAIGEDCFAANCLLLSKQELICP